MTGAAFYGGLFFVFFVVCECLVFTQAVFWF